jgi:hypothetical protein
LLGFARRNISDALSRSPGITAGTIVLTTLLAIVFGAFLTPSTNVSAVPFVLPIVAALYQGERWVKWTTIGILLIYLAVAFGLQSVVLSAGLINLVGLIFFGMIFVRVAGQRQRLHQHAAWLEQMEENLQFAMRNSNVRLFSQDAELRYT